MLRFVKIIAIPVTGVAIFFFGLIYDVIYAGIPYQDPTPEMQTRYNFHASIADWIYGAGAIIFILGLVLIPVIWIRTRRRR